MISQIFEISASLFDSIITVYFITKFNYASFRKNYYIIPAILIPFAFQLFADAYLQQSDLLATLIQFVLSLIYALLICRGFYLRAFLSTCIYKVTLITLNSTLISLYSLFIRNIDLFYIGGGGIARYSVLVTCKILLGIVLCLILRFYNRENNGTLLNSILTFSFSVITVVGLRFALIILETSPASPIRRNLLAIISIFLVLNIFLYLLLNQIGRLQKHNFELKLLNEKSKFEEEKYQEALAAWNTSEKIRHDVRHHMAAISGMIRSGNADGCQEYLDEYLEQIQNNGKFTRSGNTVIDYLLESKLSGLEDTETVITGSAQSLADIRDADLASLVGNILDNAIEAEENVSKKRIELHFSSQNDNRIIICKNNIETSVLSENKGLKSTKRDSNHGLGHQIVAEIVKKYNGLIDYFEDQQMFGVQIVLPKRQG